MTSGALLVLAGTALGILAPAAAQAQDSGSASDRRFYVVEVDGPVDSLVRDQIMSALARADDPATAGIMLRFKKVPGSLGIDTVGLAQAVRDAPVPVIGYVGPAGSSEVAGGGILVLAATDVVVLAPDVTIGPLNPVDLATGSTLTPDEAVAVLADLRPQGGSVDAWANLVDRRAAVGDGGVEGVSDLVQPTVGEALLNVDGRTVVLPGGQVVRIDTFDITQPEGADQPEAQLKVLVIFMPMGYVDGFLHKIHTPTYAYVMVVIGLLAIAFEFFSVSIGIAGVLGAVCLSIGLLSAGALPVNWWAIALLFAAIGLLCIDVQQGTLGGFTILGAVAMVVGSVFFTGSGAFDVHWWAVVLCVAGTLFFFAVAMTTVVRTRFATPTIGRDNLLDASGVVVADLEPEGTVEIEGAVWKARAHRGRISSGTAVTVRSIQGIALEVDPVDGDSKGESRTPT